jgi:hypothetical protein
MKMQSTHIRGALAAALVLFAIVAPGIAAAEPSCPSGPIGQPCRDFKSLRDDADNKRRQAEEKANKIASELDVERRARKAAEDARRAAEEQAKNARPPVVVPPEILRCVKEKGLAAYEELVRDPAGYVQRKLATLGKTGSGFAKRGVERVLTTPLPAQPTPADLDRVGAIVMAEVEEAAKAEPLLQCLLPVINENARKIKSLGSQVAMFAKPPDPATLVDESLVFKGIAMALQEPLPDHTVGVIREAMASHLLDTAAFANRNAKLAALVTELQKLKAGTGNRAAVAAALKDAEPLLANQTNHLDLMTDVILVTAKSLLRQTFIEAVDAMVSISVNLTEAGIGLLFTQLGQQITAASGVFEGTGYAGMTYALALEYMYGLPAKMIVQNADKVLQFVGKHWMKGPKKIGEKIFEKVIEKTEAMMRAGIEALVDNTFGPHVDAAVRRAFQARMKRVGGAADAELRRIFGPGFDGFMRKVVVASTDDHVKSLVKSLDAYHANVKALAQTAAN